METMHFDDQYLTDMDHDTKHHLRDAARKAYDTMLQSKELRHHNETRALMAQIANLKTELAEARTTSEASAMENSRLKSRNVELEHNITNYQRRLEDAEEEYREIKVEHQEKLKDREAKILDKVKTVFRREMKKRNDVIVTQQKALRLLQDSVRDKELEMDEVAASHMETQALTTQSLSALVAKYKTEMNRMERLVMVKGQEIDDLTSVNHQMKMKLIDANELGRQLETAQEKVDAQTALFNEQQDLIRVLAKKLEKSRKQTAEEKQASEEIETKLENMKSAWNLVGSFLDALPKSAIRTMRIKAKTKGTLEELMSSLTAEGRRKGKAKTAKSKKKSTKSNKPATARRCVCCSEKTDQEAEHHHHHHHCSHSHSAPSSPSR